MDMVMKQILCYCLGLLSCTPALSQEWTFGQVEKLPATVNTAAEEAMPLLSPDGRTLYFTRFMDENNVGGKYTGQDVWVSKFDGTRWSKADNRNHLLNKNKNNNAVVGISADGQTLYLLNASSNRKVKGIYFSKNINGNWTDPELIPIEGIEPEGFVGFYVSPDFEVILISMKGTDSRGEEDLYVCVKSGSGVWSRPKNLGSAINTLGFEISPFLTGDKKRLFFSSNGHPGLGDADIFYSDRLYDSWETWTIPKNLGNKINSKKFDAYFSMRDSLAFFSSNRDNQVSDLYNAVVKSTTDKTQQEVEKIIAEAKSLLGDLGGTDSTRSRTASIFIEFDYGSGKIDSKAVDQLDKILTILRNREFNKITLIGYSEDFTSEPLNTELSNKRMQSIQGYLERALIPGLEVRYELKKSEKKKSSGKNGIELRYNRFE